MLEIKPVTGGNRCLKWNDIASLINVGNTQLAKGDLTGEHGEIIKDKYRLAVTQLPEELVTRVPCADTAFFLLSKKELQPSFITPTLPLTSLGK